MSHRILKTPDSQPCHSLDEYLHKCPNFQCVEQPALQLDLTQLTQITNQCFQSLNQKLKNMSQQTGGGTKPKDSQQLKISQLYQNVIYYLKLHNISHLTSKTLIPYGIIVSTLQLPDDTDILQALYPDLMPYLSNVNNSIEINFQTQIPVGIFLNNTDIKNINKKILFNIQLNLIQSNK